MNKEIREVTNQEILNELKKINQSIKSANKLNLKGKFISAVVAGFGTVVGATVVVALLIFILSKLSNIEIIRPIVENIVQIVDQQKSK